MKTEQTYTNKAIWNHDLHQYYDEMDGFAIDNFDVVREDFQIEYFGLPTHRILVQMNGEVSPELLLSFYKQTEKVQDKVGKSFNEIILDIRNLKNMTVASRQTIEENDHRIKKRFNNIFLLISDRTKAIHKYYELYNPDRIKNIHFFINLEDLLSLIDNRKGSSTKTTGTSNSSLDKLSKEDLIKLLTKERQEKKSLIEERDKELENIFKLIGSTTWGDESNPSPINYTDDTPYSDLYHALSIHQRDVAQLLKDYKNLYTELENKVVERTQLHKQNEALIRAVLDSTERTVWVVRSDLSISDYNNKYENFVKNYYQIKVEKGMNILSFVKDEADIQTWKERYNVAFSGKSVNFDKTYTINGDTIYYDFTISPVFKDNEVIGAAVFGVDVTEKRITEQRIKENEELLRSINKNLTEAIYRSGPNKGLVYINEAFAKMFGFNSPQEVMDLPTTLDLYAHEEDRRTLGERLMTEKQYSNVEVKFKRRNGEEFWGLMSSILTILDGEVYFDGAIRDITEQKKVSQQLEEQNFELKKLNEELDSFVYSASHDLKAPLTSIKGLVNIAQNEKDIDKLPEYFRMMLTSIEKLDDFIRDIISLSRNSRLEIETEQIDFNGLINDVIDSYNYLDSASHVEKIIKIDKERPLYSDSKRIRIILNNLISNAIRYSDPKKEQPFVKIRIQDLGDYFKIIVSDNGLGIPEEHIDKIFNMFYRASESSNGSGLGLYIVKETSEKLGGSTTVESTLKEGTKFTVVLPNKP